MSLANASSPDQGSATILPFKPRSAAESRSATYERLIRAVETAGLAPHILIDKSGDVGIAFDIGGATDTGLDPKDLQAVADMRGLFEADPTFRDMVVTRCAWLDAFFEAARARLRPVDQLDAASPNPA